VTFDSGGLSPGNASGNCQLAINSDGFWYFSGHVHEAGIVGDKYVISLALLDVKDASGATLVQFHTGTVHGQLVPGASDDNFEGGPSDSGFDQRIVDQWDAAVKSRIRSSLHVATDLGDVTSLIFDGLIVAALVSGGAVCVRGTDVNGQGFLACSHSSGDGT